MSPTKTITAFLLSSVLVVVMALPTKPTTNSSSNYCYSKDPKPYMRFGSMEAYEPKHGDLSRIRSPKGKTISEEKNAKENFIEGA